MFWLKAEASQNIKYMLVTPEVSHALMSSLKDAAAVLQKDPVLPQNKNCMLVTPEVSHAEMWPYEASAAVGSESHAATAVLMLLSVMTLFVCCTGRGVGFGIGSSVGAGAG